MKKTVLKYGAFASLAISTWMVFSFGVLSHEVDLENGMWMGYTAMLISFSFIFVAVKTYRDKESNGSISFGKAFNIGLLISLITSTIYVIVWLLIYKYLVPDYMDKYVAATLKEMQLAGESLAKINSEKAEMEQMAAMYKSPFYRVLFTYAEILPVGLLVSLLSALILRRKVSSHAAG